MKCIEEAEKPQRRRESDRRGRQPPRTGHRAHAGASVGGDPHETRDARAVTPIFVPFGLLELPQKKRKNE